MSRQRIVIAGGSGFLGRAITADLTVAGYEPVILTRGPERVEHGARFVRWDGKTPGPWISQLDGAAAVINLAGRSVNCRYTAANRREILESRLDSVRALGEAIARCAAPPSVWVQSGTAAIYGDAGERLCDERTPPGDGFSPDTAVAWEEAFHQLPLPATRRVLLRIGFALGADGGALGTLAVLARCFLGGRVGPGRQWMSWLHVKDLSRIVRWAIERQDVEGLLLAVSPNPVRNDVFMCELRRAVGRPWSPPAPRWAVRIGSWLLRTEPELALRSRRCVPRRLLDLGFTFDFPDLPGAFDDLFRKPRASTNAIVAARHAS